MQDDDARDSGSRGLSGRGLGVPSFKAQFTKLKPQPGDLVVIQVPKDTPYGDIEKLFAAVSPIPVGCKVIAINESMSVNLLSEDILDAMGLMWKPKEERPDHLTAVPIGEDASPRL